MSTQGKFLKNCTQLLCKLPEFLTAYLGEKLSARKCLFEPIKQLIVDPFHDGIILLRQKPKKLYFFLNKKIIAKIYKYIINFDVF